MMPPVVDDWLRCGGQTMQLKSNAGLADKEVPVKLVKYNASNSEPASTRAAAARQARRDSCFEKLEDRTLFSTFIVNVAGDPTSMPASQVSLRKAVNEANAMTGVSIIKFDPTVFSTPMTIDLQKPLEVSNPSASIGILGPTAQLTINQDMDMLTAAEVNVDPKATLTVNHLNFINDSGVYDTAVINNAGHLAILNGTISAASNNNGIRAIYNTGLLKLGLVTIANHGDGNSGIAIGGGLYNNGGRALLVDDSFNSDDAGSGGAIGQARGSLIALNITINNCGADTNARGGAVAINGGRAAFANCTIANSFMVAEGTPAGSFGVAIYAKASNVLLINDTITNSQLFPLGFGNPGDVPTSGAICVGPEARIEMGNTVVSGMSEVAGVPLGTGPEIVGHVNSLGHNFIGQKGATTSGLTPTDLVGTHASPLNPKLNALANNGGFVQTELPKVGSPLINAGDNSLVPAGITTDERGKNRIFGGIVDIGAVETDYVLKRWPIVVSPFRG